jgi:hypothetical protein
MKAKAQHVEKHAIRSLHRPLDALRTLQYLLPSTLARQPGAATWSIGP